MPPRKTFGEALRKMLDDSKMFTRPEWADFLDRSEEELELWTEDREMPDPVTLRMLLAALADSDGIPQAVFEEWESIAHLPIRTTAPGFLKPGSRYYPHYPHVPINTLRMYVMWPRYEALLRRVSSFPVEDQEALLDFLTGTYIPELLAKRNEKP
jgi:hypothetical protein